jgi:CHAD domain-containing protein
MATTTEVERKYEVPVDFALPDLRAVPGVARIDDPAEHRLDATYYDTPDLRLAQHRVTLRRRSGGHDAGWHLKRPAGGERTETHEPPTTDPGQVPAALAAQVRALSRGESLAPVARIRTRRLERPVRGADGSVLALLADDVVASEALTEPVLLQQWRELEVELVDGSRGVLAALDAALLAAGARPARTRSKLAHALADSYPPDRPTQEPDASRAARSLADYLSRQRSAILDADPGVRAGDADSVHDMRVATRRLRATLRTFRPLLDPARTEPLRAELRWLGAVLGAVRDGDVLAKRLAGAIAAEPPELVVGPVAARVGQRLRADTGQARAELSAALDGPRYTALLDALDTVIDTAPGRIRGRRLRRAARKALRRADRRLDTAERARTGNAASRRLPLPGTGDPDVALHEARKAYKRGRYAVEAVVPLAGRPARRLAKRLNVLQDVLGAHQDTIVAGRLLRDYGMRAHLDGDNAFTYGLLHARQQSSGARALADLPRARRRAGKRRLRRVLD